MLEVYENTEETQGLLKEGAIGWSNLFIYIAMKQITSNLVA